MKNVSKAMLVCFVMFATFIVSCDKEITTSPLTLDKSQKAIIKGYVYADLDQTKLGDEAVPAGTRVIISVPYSELGLTGSGSLIDTLEIDNEGSFTYSVPVKLNGSEVTAKVIDFTYDQVQPLDFSNQNATIKKIFVGASMTFSNLKPSDVQIQKITLATKTFIDPVDYYNVSGQFKCERDSSSDGLETVPAGTNFIFSTTGWSTKVTLAADGKYTVAVPADKPITVEYDFTTTGKNKAQTYSYTLKFKNSFTLSSGYPSDTDKQNKTLANGELQ